MTETTTATTCSALVHGNAAAWEEMMTEIEGHGGLGNLSDAAAAILLHGMITRWEGREVAGPYRWDS